MTDQLSRTLAEQGDRVMSPWPTFNKYVKLFTRTSVNVFAVPGVGKSMFARNLLYRIDAPSLYVTLDMPLTDQAIHTWALVSGVPIATVEGRREYFMRQANRIMRARGTHVEWSDVPMNTDEIGELVLAVGEFFGRPPRVIVIDVIGEVVNEMTYQGYMEAFRALNNIADSAHATVITLHHAKKDREAWEPVTMRDIEYAGDKQPNIVIGLHRPNQGRLIAAVLKNRRGPARPDGSLKVRFQIHADRGLIEEVA